jgi:hypothetical protein
LYCVEASISLPIYMGLQNYQGMSQSEVLQFKVARAISSGRWSTKFEFLANNHSFKVCV